jgi:two-component system, sensor histidine kinase PdtaS
MRLFLTSLILLLSFKAYCNTPDSLLLQLSKESVPKAKVDLLNQLAQYMKNNDPDSGIYFAQQALLISEKDNYKKGKGESFNNLGNLYFVKSNYDSALVNYLQGLKFFKEIKDTLLISTSYLNIAMIYNKQDKYVESYKLNFAALKLQEKLGNKENLFYAYHNLASLLYKYNKINKAKTFYEEAKNIALEINRSDLVARSLNNLANIYIDEGDFDVALKCLSTSLKINLENSNKRSLGFTYGTIGNVYEAQKNYDEALINILKSNEIFEELGEKFYVAVGNFNIGNLLLSIKKPKEASRYILEAQKIAMELNKMDIVLQCEKKLSQIYQDANDYKMAFHHQLLYDSLKEKSIIESNQKVLEELQVKYETEKAEKEILFLKEENAQQALLNQEDKAYKNYLYMGMVVLVFAGAAVTRRYKEYKKNNQKLEALVKERTAVIEAKKKEVELMLQEIHHRVKNNMQLIKSLVNLQLKFKPKISANDLAEELKIKIDCMAVIHNKLYKASDLSGLSSREYFSELFQYLSQSFKSSYVKFESDIEDFKLSIDKMVPCGLIINELVTNAYKHNFDNNSNKGLIYFNFRKENDKYVLTVKDNGLGIQDFEVSNISTLGLSLIYDLAGQIDGQVTISNNNGAEVFIEF